MREMFPDSERASEGASGDPATLCRDADSLRQRGLFARAAQLLEQAIAVDPHSYDARLSLAQVRSAQARHEEAVAHLTRLTWDHPSRPLPWWLLSMALSDAGRSTDALSSLERYATLVPNDVAAQIRCAELALDLGGRETAFAMIAHARSMDRMNAVARFLEGRALFEDGDTGPAMEAYRDAVRKAPHLGEPSGGRILEAWTIDLPSWANTGSGKCRVLVPSQALRLPKPRVLPSAEAESWVMRDERIPEIFIARLDNAEVLTPEFTVLAPDGCFFVEGLVTSPTIYPRKGKTVKYASDDGRVLLDLPRTPIDLDAACILLGRSSNYFHFLLESLPRIWSVEQLGLDGNLPALVPQDLHQTELDLLALLGFSEERLIRVSDGASARCRTLYVPSLLGRGYIVSPLAVRFLRERVLTKVSDIPQLPTRIYLSRNKMRRRHVRNEPDLLEILEQHGFRVVYPEELDVTQQVQLFAHADAILSPDSSALANIAFAKSGAKVGVFNWRGLYKPLWHCIAFHVGAELTYIHADPIVESDRVLAHRDMRVDESLLDAWLDTL